MGGQDERIAEELKTLIDREGKGYLADEPYEVYKELTEKGIADNRIVSAILCVLVNDLQSRDFRENVKDLSQRIQKKCGFNKRLADRLAFIFGRLYSKENNDEWECRENEGLRQFLKGEFISTWNGYAVWNEGNGSIDCHYEARIILQPLENVTEDAELMSLLRKNSFLKKESIADYFREKFCRYLDDIFEEYCTCDDYYPPVVEDFEVDAYVLEWCRKFGFEYISCDGKGADGGYQPNFRRGWY